MQSDMSEKERRQRQAFTEFKQAIDDEMARHEAAVRRSDAIARFGWRIFWATVILATVLALFS